MSIRVLINVAWILMAGCARRSLDGPQLVKPDPRSPLKCGTARSNRASTRLGFAPPDRLDLPLHNFIQALPGDFYGNEKADLAILHSTSEENEAVTVLLSQKNSLLPVSVETVFPSLDARIAAAADLNGDRASDLVLVAPSGLLFSLISTGDGSFRTMIGYLPQPGEMLTWGAIADLNQNGIADIVVISKEKDGASWVNAYLGDGNGDFKAVFEQKLSSPAYIEAGSLADVDCDGMVDLLLLDSAFSISIIQGSTGGSFETSSVQVLSTFPARATNVAVGDYNGDGYPDAAVSVSKGCDRDNSPCWSGLQLFEGNGRLDGFGNPTVYDDPETNTMMAPDLSSIDINGDGYTDLASWEGPSVEAIRLGNERMALMTSQQGLNPGDIFVDSLGNGRPETIAVDAGPLGITLWVSRNTTSD